MKQLNGEQRNETLNQVMKAIGAGALVSAAAAAAPAAAANFGDDLAFLQQRKDVVVLTDKAGLAKVALVADWQGRVMTSTAGGDSGLSFGWINRQLIASGEVQPHINVFGGEDRFWLGPEGGQFSLFFAQGVPFDFDHWYTPAAIDTMPFKIVSKSKTSAKFSAAFSLTNYSGTVLDLKVLREVRLLAPKEAWKHLGLAEIPGVQMVAFESENKITNAGRKPWTKQSGMVSVWILGMFNPSPLTTVVVPIRPGPESELGKAVTSDYFGNVPPERLVVKSNVIYFKADGQYRSKIGIGPKRSLGVLGSYDAANRVLTLAQYTQPPGVTDYVNSLWKLQDDPFNGDVANSYNDGPVAPGAKPLGPFYELESSSPAAALSPGKSLTHIHRTIHLIGSEEQLDAVAKAVLGVTLQEIKNGLPK